MIGRPPSTHWAFICVTVASSFITMQYCVVLAQDDTCLYLRPFWWSENFLPDSSFETGADLVFKKGSYIDYSVSYSNDGTGSGILPEDTPAIIETRVKNMKKDTYDERYYTFSVMVKSEMPHTNVFLACRYRIDSTGPNFPFNKHYRFPIDDTGSWHEATLIVEPPENARYIFCYVGRGDGPQQSGNIWVDNVYLGAGIRFRNSPIQEKSTFNGLNVRINCRGNMFMNTDSGWTHFFPVGIYVSEDDGSRPACTGSEIARYRPTHISKYAVKGFNTYMWAWDHNQLFDAAQAGFLVGLNITRFVSSKSEKGRYYGDTATLGTILRTILNSQYKHHLIFYYWDNEDYDELDTVYYIINHIRSIEQEIVGGPWCPVYALQGFPAMASRFNDTINLAGTYFAFYDGNVHDPCTYRDSLLHPRTTTWFMLQYGHNQKTPPFLAQFNYFTTYSKFRDAFWKAITTGASAIAYYKDPHYPLKIKLTHTSWWNKLPPLLDTLNALMPIIIKPFDNSISISTHDKPEYIHCIDHSVRYTDSAKFVFLYNSCNYQIDMQVHSHQQTETYTVTDFFSHDTIKNINNNYFQITVMPKTLKVIKITQDMPTTTHITPYNNQITIQNNKIIIPKHIQGTWTLTDLSGKIIKQGKTQANRKTVININNTKYISVLLLSVTNNKHSKTVKILKIEH